MRILLFIMMFLAIGSITSGCRFGDATQIQSGDFSGDISAMSLADAKKIIDYALFNVPKGRRPKNPGYHIIGQYAEVVELKEHNRTGFCLVEVKSNARTFLRFYQRDRAQGERFACAVKRLCKEYRSAR